jgi:hypothetical protein
MKLTGVESAPCPPRTNNLVAGSDGYMEVPINPDTFIAEVEVHLKTPRS